MEQIDDRTKSQRWSDNISEFCGSWGFVFWFSVIVVTWMAINSWIILFKTFDPYPYILLNLFLTVVGTMQSPIIMMAQNRQVDRDREMVRGIHDKLDRILGETRE